MRHDHDDDDSDFELPDPDPSEMLRRMFGGGMPRLPGMEHDSMDNPHEVPMSDPDIDPEPLPTRKTFAIGNKVVLNAKGRSRRQKFPRYPSYGVVVEVFPANIWLSNKGMSHKAKDIADCVVALRTGKKKGEPVLFFYHSSSLDLADMNKIQDDPELSSYRLPERKMFCLGDKIVIDENVSGKFYPRNPCYGIISDVFPDNEFMTNDGTPGCSVDFHDVMIRVVVSDGETTNFAAHSSELKYFTGK